MIASAITAMLGMTAIVGGWLAVQSMSSRSAGMAPGQDPLAGRLGCRGCDCRSVCKEAEGDHDAG